MQSENLTSKQQSFVDEYLKDRNGTQAAIRAGYSAKTANAAAGRLLSNVSIKSAIMAASERVTEMAQIDAAWVLRQAAEVYEVARNSDDLASALKALDQCGKHQAVGAFKDKLELSGAIDTNWTVTFHEGKE